MSTATHPTDALGEALPLPHARAADPSPAAELTLALASAVQAPTAALGRRLAARVAASRQAHAAMVTRRQPRQRLPAQTWAPGVQAWPLHGQSWLLELAADARVTAPLNGALELLVLAGTLQVGDDALAACGHALLPAGTPLRAGAEPARLYLRGHQPGPFSAPAQPLLHPTPTWQPLRAGVDICPLYGEGAALSMLARLQPGARVPAHPHGIDEECLMVEGDLFLGDLLLREGEFQFAPQGSQHGDLFADSPCLLFFHGAVDAAAVDNAHREAQGWPALG